MEHAHERQAGKGVDSRDVLAQPDAVLGHVPSARADHRGHRAAALDGHLRLGVQAGPINLSVLVLHVWPLGNLALNRGLVPAESAVAVDVEPRLVDYVEGGPGDDESRRARGHDERRGRLLDVQGLRGPRRADAGAVFQPELGALARPRGDLRVHEYPLHAAPRLPEGCRSHLRRKGPPLRVKEPKAGFHVTRPAGHGYAERNRRRRLAGLAASGCADEADRDDAALRRRLWASLADEWALRARQDLAARIQDFDARGIASGRKGLDIERGVKDLALQVVERLGGCDAPVLV